MAEEISNVPMIQTEEQASGLLRLAIEQKMPVEILERLVALQERVTDRSARAEFFDALARCQEEIPSIHKGKTAQIITKAGGKYSYAYAPLDAIAEAIREPLRRHGLSYAWTVEEGGGGGVLVVVCILRHISGHEERASFPVPVDTAAAMSGAQKNGAALTYGKRQSLTSVLGLTTTDDDLDGAGVTNGAEAPSGLITAEQWAELEALVVDAGADRGRFLAYIGAEDLRTLPAARFGAAKMALEARKAAKK